jgi:urea transport system ATP-binding protein
VSPMVMSRGRVMKAGLGADMERDNIRDFVAL